MSSNQLRILKKAKCQSTSGKSTLTYHIGVNVEGDVFFRIAENNGGGFFSAEWVALKDIQKALSRRPDNITSVALYGLFRGNSVNTPSFLLAALKAEKLIQRVKGRTRKHERSSASDRDLLSYIGPTRWSRNVVCMGWTAYLSVRLWHPRFARDVRLSTTDRGGCVFAWKEFWLGRKQARFSSLARGRCGG